ncbi:Hpt domain-containing protein [Vibrio ezurae]|uniref:HPt domain-containing protein n=1 Tax=Vibrio ezurae NBRC 102218 TaxID=1219080 RepID=U3CJ84_9VIBR|nr:Hpt domain-containing protein [Vibrio ezurae]GAD81214.1 hypothetical protein VEZ01S_53_00130 [Vibrio ezurae NBRC 102218]
MDEFNLLQNDKIVSLSAQVGEEMMSALLDLFKQELQQYIGQVESIDINSQTREQIARTCHAIKGSAPSFGAILLTEKAAEMDGFYKQQRFSEFDQQCAGLLSILRRTVYKLEQLQQQLR